MKFFGKRDRPSFLRSCSDLPGAGSVAAVAGAADKRLDVYWVDVEGGAATLLVTPAGESVLIDTGYPGDRDADRVNKAVTELAGLQKIDHLIITHFHRDHYGGLDDIVKRVPVGTLYERGPESAPEKDADARRDARLPARPRWTSGCASSRATSSASSRPRARPA